MLLSLKLILEASATKTSAVLLAHGQAEAKLLEAKAEAQSLQFLREGEEMKLLLLLLLPLI